MNIEANKRSQRSVQVPGFPVGQFGDYSVLTWIEENQNRVFGPIEFKIGIEIAKAHVLAK